jgi:ABC-type transport system substrate-binding protein
MRRLLCSTFAVLVLVAAGCTDAADDEQTIEAPSVIPTPRTLLRVGAEAWPDCLNPITCNTPVLHHQVLQHVLPVAFEVSADNELVPSPLLAGEPEAEVVGDLMTVTYRLDSDARWVDGQPITSSDIRGTWQAILSTPGADTTGYDRITAIDDTDPRVAVASFSSPYGGWRRLFGGGRGYVLQADAFAGDVDLSGRFVDELPMAAAPYRLAAWDEDAAVLATNENYWDAAREPLVDQVGFERIDLDDLDAPQAYDLLLPADGAAAGTQAPEGFDSWTVPTTEMIGVWFDRRTPLLQPLAHRQALAAAIDRDQLAELLTAGGSDDDVSAVDCLGWLPAVGPWCEAAEAELPALDRRLAAFALAVQPRDGQPFAVPLTHDAALAGAGEVADALEVALAEAGVLVQRGTVSGEAFLKQRAAHESVGVGVFAFDLGLFPNVTQLYGCPGGLDSSVVHWCDPEVVAAALALTDTVDPDARLALVATIGAEAGADVAWLPLLPRTDRAFFRPDRVRVPSTTSVAGGALADLRSFEVEG